MYSTQYSYAPQGELAGTAGPESGTVLKPRALCCFSRRVELAAVQVPHIKWPERLVSVKKTGTRNASRRPSPYQEGRHPLKSHPVSVFEASLSRPVPSVLTVRFPDLRQSPPSRNCRPVWSACCQNSGRKAGPVFSSASSRHP